MSDEPKITPSSNTSNVSSEPPVHKGLSVYPYNNVKKTRSGHIFEEDDTLGNERIKRQHTTGSYDEYIPDGSRDVRIVGDDYNIIIKDKTLTVAGNLVINVLTNCDIRITEDYNLHCKNFNLIVDEDMTVKIGGNEKKDVVGETNINAGQNYNLVSSGANYKIKGDSTTRIDGKNDTTIAGKDSLSVLGGKVTSVTGDNLNYTSANTAIVSDNLLFSSSGKTDYNAGGNINISGGNIEIEDEVNAKGVVTSKIDCIGESISLVGHTHTQGGGNDAGAGGTTTPPN